VSQSRAAIAEARDSSGIQSKGNVHIASRYRVTAREDRGDLMCVVVNNDLWSV
jgi:hypothetical protein